MLTPVFLPGESHGQGSLAGYSPCGRKELDTTERLHRHIISNISLIITGKKKLDLRNKDPAVCQALLCALVQHLKKHNLTLDHRDLCLCWRVLQFYSYTQVYYPFGVNFCNFIFCMWIFWHHMLKRQLFLPLHGLSTLVKYQLTINLRVYFEISILFH